MADEPNRTHQRRFSLWWLVPVGVLLGFALFGDNGVVDLIRRHQYRQQLQSQVDQLRRENEQLHREIEALKSDWRTIEAIARQKLGMVRPDEVVYQFPGADKGEKRDAVKPGKRPEP